jgi:hypothetical protein
LSINHYKAQTRNLGSEMTKRSPLVCPTQILIAIKVIGVLLKILQLANVKKGHLKVAQVLLQMQIMALWSCVKSA